MYRRLLFFLLALTVIAVVGCSSTNPEPDWVGRTVHLQAEASSDSENPAQQKLMAKRGAEVLMRKDWWQQVAQLPVDEQSTVADYVSENWMPSSIEPSHEYRKSGIHAVKAQVPLRLLWEEVCKVRDKGQKIEK